MSSNIQKKKSNILYAGATFYYYIVLTNKRVIMKGLDCYFKKTNEHSVPIEDIQSVSQHKKNEKCL